MKIKRKKARLPLSAIVADILAPPKFSSGRCRYCHCTDDHACDEGCEWIDDAHTVCSNTVCMHRYVMYLERKMREFVRLWLSRRHR